MYKYKNQGRGQLGVKGVLVKPNEEIEVEKKIEGNLNGLVLINEKKIKNKKEKLEDE